MRFLKFRAAVLLAAILSLSQAFPAFAAHDVLESDSYILTETEDDSFYCTDLKGKPLTGWVADEDDNLFYFKKGEMDYGWDKIHGEWYYFDPDTGILATNTTVLNYDVDEDGRMVRIREW